MYTVSHLRGVPKAVIKTAVTEATLPRYPVHCRGRLDFPEGICIFAILILTVPHIGACPSLVLCVHREKLQGAAKKGD